MASRNRRTVAGMASRHRALRTTTRSAQSAERGCVRFALSRRVQNDPMLCPAGGAEEPGISARGSDVEQRDCEKKRG